VLGPRHAEVRRLRELLRDPRARAEQGAFVVEGPRAVAAALDRGVVPETVYLAAGAEQAFGSLAARVRTAGGRVATLREGVLERVGTTVTPQPVLAVARAARPRREVLGGEGLVVVLVEVRDPGNLGTIVRSAEAAGAAAILLGPGSVDAYNPKVVRASAGAIFGIPVVEAAAEGWTAVDALVALGALGRQRLGAVAAHGMPYELVDFTLPTAVVLGNEAYGFDEDVASCLDGRVSIPMRAPAESINVAMAASVLCFEAARQRR